MLNGGSNWVQCTQYAVFMVTSAALIVLFGILLSLQCKKYGGCRVRDLCSKTKTWVFVTILIFLLFILLDNVFEPVGMPWTLSTLLLAAIILSRQVTAILLFEFFRKRIVKLMPVDLDLPLRRIKITLIIVTSTCFAALCAAYVMKVRHIRQAPDYGDEKQDAKYLCHSPAIVVDGVTWVVFTACMTIVG